MKKLLWFVLACLFPLSAIAAVQVGPNLKVVDGDTVRYYKTYIRAWGYDSPNIGRFAKCEKERALGEKAKAKLIKLMSAPHEPSVYWEKGQDMYGRRKGWLYSDGERVDRIMINAGLAKAWGGRTAKPNWCR